MNIEIFADEFTAMPIESLDEVNDCQGATGGFLYPSGIAKHYCGIETFSVGDIMAYGFRRFGYPVNGWDDYKTLCQWIIRTPMEGVFLLVKPTSVSPFGYFLKDPLTEELSKEQSAHWREWGKQCHKWAKETHGIILISQGHWAGHYTDEEFELASEEWLRKTYASDYTDDIDSVKQLASKKGITAKELVHRFWNEKIDECQKFANEYKQEHPVPERQDNRSCHVLSEDVPETPFWENLPEDSLERKINEAIRRTLLDLKRPVCVRDWQLEIDGGKLPGSNLEEKWEELSEKITGPIEWVKYAVDKDGDETDELLYDYYAPESRMAGYGVDPDTVGNDEWYKVCEVFCDQFGSAGEGIKQLAKFLSNGGSLANNGLQKTPKDGEEN